MPGTAKIYVYQPEGLKTWRWRAEANCDGRRAMYEGPAATMLDALRLAETWAQAKARQLAAYAFTDPI